MGMKTMLVRVSFAIVAFSALWYIALANSGVRETRTAALTTLTTGSQGKNLDDKMFTLSDNSGGIVFYPPYMRPPTTQTYPNRFDRTNQLYPTQSYTTTPSTPAPTVIGVSVCLRYLMDSRSVQQFFRLGSDSGYSLYLDLQDTNTYSVRFNNHYNALSLQPTKNFLGPISELWTSLCLTVDNKKKVAQVFSGSKMSIRKLMPGQLAWSGEPVIEFSSFSGQLTDVQVWDYPIRYKNVVSYLYRDYFSPQRGSVITWSSINYSLRGNALLEDSFEKQHGDVARKRMQKKFLAAKHQDGDRQQL